jgi:hypothetical protein
MWHSRRHLFLCRSIFIEWNSMAETWSNFCSYQSIRKEFKKDYSIENFFLWHTRDSLVYRILNQTLRTKQEQKTHKSRKKSMSTFLPFTPHACSKKNLFDPAGTNFFFHFFHRSFKWNSELHLFFTTTTTIVFRFIDHLQFHNVWIATWLLVIQRTCRIRSTPCRGKPRVRFCRECFSASSSVSRRWSQLLFLNR